MEKLSDLSSCDYFNAIGDRTNTKQSLKYGEAVSLVSSSLKEIERGIVTSIGVQKENWRLLSYHREYVIKIGRALELLSLGNKMKAQESWKELLDFIRRSEPEIQESFDVYQLIEVATNYTGFSL